MKNLLYLLLLVIFFWGCTNNRSENNYAHNINLLSCINLDSIRYFTDITVERRSKFILFRIHNRKDDYGNLFFIRDIDGELILRNQHDYHLNHLNNYDNPILDSIYLQKNRISYCYLLMNKYPFKKIQYSAGMKTIRVDIDTFKFINVSVPPILMENKLRKLNDNWWVYN